MNYLFINDLFRDWSNDPRRW